jgi:amidase
VCARAVRTFESLGCIVEEAVPDFDAEAVWQALIRLRGWQQGGSLLGYYHDPAKRAQLKPEAIFEVETGLEQSAYDITAASVVRTRWYGAVCRFFERYDYLVLPTAQVFPFDVEQHWPHAIDGRAMQTYHEWMKASLLVTMSGCPALAAPAGFSAQGLPIGIQLIGPNRSELDCLRLAYAYESAMDPAWRRMPGLLTQS